MVFWIVLGAVVALALIIGIWQGNAEYDFGYGVGAFFVTLLLGSVVGIIGLVITFANTIHTHEYKDTEVLKWNLRAIGNDQQLSGRQYFLGGGYIGEKQVVRFITESNGAVKLDQLNATDAVIFEDTTKPELIRTKTTSYVPWLVPWELGYKYHFDFHVPNGTVVQDYKLDVTTK